MALSMYVEGSQSVFLIWIMRWLEGDWSPFLEVIGRWLEEIGSDWHLSTSGQYWKNRKNLLFWYFAKFTCAILCILWPGPAGSGRGYQWSPKTHSPESLDAFSCLYRYHDSSRSKVIAIWKFRILVNFTTLRILLTNLSKSWNSPKFEIFKLQ